MQKIVLFIEPNAHKYDTTSKIGNLFMNRCTIDEDESNEIVKVFQLEFVLGSLDHQCSIHFEDDPNPNYNAQ